MKYKPIYLLTPLLLLFSAAVLVFFINTSADKREEYENYLLSEFKKISPHDGKDLKDIPKMNRPDMAALQDYYRIMDPETKRVPRERLRQGRQIAEKLQQQKSSRESSIEWENVSSDMGGRTRSLMWDPNDESQQKVWAGSVTGGLWYNENITDTESSWTPVNDMWENLSISSITYDPNNTETFYAGTGEIETAVVTYRESSTKGVGIWKSVDGGNSWELLPATEDFEYVPDVVVREEGTGESVVYAAVGSGTYKGEEHHSQPTDGLYRSTDGGQSWEQVLPQIEGDTLPFTPSDIELGPEGKIYVGTMPNLNDNGGATILMSENGTSGSWTVYDDIREEIENSGSYPLPGRVIMAPSPSDKDVVYAIIAAGYNNDFEYYYGRYILRSDNQGETWYEINKPDAGDWANLAWHALIGTVDPNDPDHLIVGGLDLHHTFNAGDTWTHISDWSLMYNGGGDNYVHADQHAIDFKPGSSDEIIFGSDGGVFHTTNGTSTYPVFEQTNQDFSSLQFYTCDISPTAGEDKYIGGLQDNGSLLYQGEDLELNDMISGGDGAYAFFDNNEPNIHISSVYYNRYYFFDENSQVDYINTSSGTFVSPADYDSQNNTLFANACGFFGEDADKILRLSGIPYELNEDFLDMNTESSVPFTAVSSSPYTGPEESTIFFGSETGRVFKATGMQSLSPEVEELTSDEFPVGAVSSIALGGSEDTLLVTFSNYGIPSVWQSFDGGETWSDIEGNLPDMPVRWALYHPENNQQALLATELGVWETNLLHEEDVLWTPAVEGMANVRVDMLRIRETDNTVVAATHGRGLFTAEYPLNSVITETDDVAENHLKIYPNPTYGPLNIFSDNNEIKKAEISLKNLNGVTIFAEEIYLQNSEYTINLNHLGLAKGKYLLTVRWNSKQIAEKVILL
ncbi:MAG: T9SS type A sorting domain-containing protein [Bacteroidales bacterium]|nr:T9SS type A sorting domain-containing protein [Bacteroidales bacterium]